MDANLFAELLGEEPERSASAMALRHMAGPSRRKLSDLLFSPRSDPGQKLARSRSSQSIHRMPPVLRHQNGSKRLNDGASNVSLSIGGPEEDGDTFSLTSTHHSLLAKPSSPTSSSKRLLPSRSNSVSSLRPASPGTRRPGSKGSRISGIGSPPAGPASGLADTAPMTDADREVAQHIAGSPPKVGVEAAPSMTGPLSPPLQPAALRRQAPTLPATPDEQQRRALTQLADKPSMVAAESVIDATFERLRGMDICVRPSNRLKVAGFKIMAAAALKKKALLHSGVAAASAATGPGPGASTGAGGRGTASSASLLELEKASAAMALPLSDAEEARRRWRALRQEWHVESKAHTLRRDHLVELEAQRLRDANPNVHMELEFQMMAAEASIHYTQQEKDAARAFDERDQERSAAAGRQIARLKFQPSSLQGQRSLATGYGLVRRNRFVVPESHDPFAGTSAAHKKAVVKRPLAGKRKWTLADSVWLPRTTAGSSKDYFETRHSIERMLLADWRVARLHRGLSEFIIKVSHPKSEWASKVRTAESSLEAAEVEAVKAVLLRHARAIYGAYEWYAMVGRHAGGTGKKRGIGLVDADGRPIETYEDAITSLDVASISKVAYHTFTRDCSLLDHNCTKMQLEDIWRTVNADDKATSEAMGDHLNTRRILNRHEWLQVLIRIAVTKHIRTDPVSGFPRGSVAEALERLFYTSILGKLPRGCVQDANAFRKAHCYIEGVDSVLKEHLATLTSLFSTYSKLDARPEAEHELADRRRMSIGEWLKLMADVGLLEMELCNTSMLLQCFQWSRIRTLLDDHFYTDRSEINLRDLKFEDFLEALVRVATRAALPTREEIDEAQCEDAAELLHALREGEPLGYHEHVQRRTLGWEEGPRQHAHVLLGFLLNVIEHNIIAGCNASLVEHRAAPRKMRPEALTAADMVRFAKHRALGRRIEHMPLRVNGSETLQSMRRVESHIMDALRHVPAFDVLSPAELWTLRTALSIAKFEDGERIINQHDEGDSFYLITSGHCEVLRFDTQFSAGARGGEECVGRLHQSDCFGERALLYKEPRAASIRAGPGCRLYTVFITRDAFERALGKPLDAFARLKSGGPPPPGTTGADGEAAGAEAADEVAVEQA